MHNNQIIKSFVSGVNPDQYITSRGSVNICSWERLKIYIQMAAGYRPGDEIVGLVADEQGLQIVIRNIKT